MKKKIFAFFTFLFLPLSLVGCNKNDNRIVVAEVTRSIFYAPFYVALNDNYFLDEGLDVSVITTPGADKTMAALLSKEASVGLMGPEASIYVYNNGQENYAINFAQLTQKDGSFLVSRDYYENFTFDDLIGKTIIGGRLGGMPEMILEYVLKMKGYDVGRDDPSKEIYIRTDVQFDVMAGAFSNGEGDFVSLFEPSATQIEKLNLGYIVASLGEESGEVPYTCFSALKSYHESNKDNLQKFTNAIYKALIWVNENSSKDVADKIKDSFPATSEDELISVIDRYKSIEAWPNSLTLKEDSFNKLQDIVELAGELDKRVEYNKLVDTSYSIEASK